ncbi:MAG: hypothetical protein ACRBB0_26570, partial [Pelagimonas sp.]|uniref:hypothetical protein n=1 Tax=Pelagimonas sp. TaxID=2073170 RepID=UPI003D6B0937
MTKSPFSLGRPFHKPKRIVGAQAPMIVVPILGQSNAVGRAGLDGLPYHPAGVLQYDQAGALVAPTTPLDHRITTYSD